MNYFGSPNDSGLGLDFDRDVVASTGLIKIYDNNNNVVGSVDATHPAVTIT